MNTKLLERLDARLREFARGDVLNRSMDKWIARQGKGLQKISKEAMKFPGVQPILRKDVGGLAKAYGVSRKEAGPIMKNLRKVTAQSVRVDRKLGIMKGQYATVDELAKAKGLESTVFLKEFARTPVGRIYPSAKSFLGDPIVKGQALVRHGSVFKKDAAAKMTSHSVVSKLARKKAADALNHARKLGLRGREFAEARDRAAKEFAVKPRTVTKLMKTSKLNPLMIHKSGVVDEFRVRPKKLGWNRDERMAGKSPMSYYTNDIKDARATAADLLKRKRAGQNVGFEEGMAVANRRHFAEARDRDGEGRFASGGIPGPQDYAIAGAMAKRKKAAVAGVGTAGVLAGGAMLARNGRGRVLMNGIRQRLVK